MKILSIETSCDETAICLLSIVENNSGISFEVLGNITHSQVDVHKEFGGVFPALAKREHLKNLPIILEQILNHPSASQSLGTSPSQGRKPDIDYICVTSGPGLEPALWCGIVFAKDLGEKWSASRRIPVIPVNHMEGHILSVIVPEQTSPLTPLLQGEGNRTFEFKNSDIQFPALALLISGGHTELVLVKNIGDYEIIGRTRDDAVGEAFDKVARILGMPYPGGPEVSRLANLAREQHPHPSSQSLGHPLPKGEGSAPVFPRPMMYTKDFDFSFSGLKTAVLYYVQSLKQETPPYPPLVEGATAPLSDKMKQVIACEFENAVADVLVHKTKKALEEFGVQTLIIGGGVSANTFIKSEIKKMLDQEFPDVKLLTPDRELTGDNALMIALAGYFKIKKDPTRVYGNIVAEGNLSL